MPTTEVEREMMVSAGLPPFKYKVGDVVYVITSENVEQRHPCPDCLGTKRWMIVTPGKSHMDMACGRCNGRVSSDLPSLRYYVTKHTTRRLTIGMLKTDSYDPKSKCSYMCNETGIGSGSVWGEHMLFEDENVARDICRIKDEEAVKAQAVTPQATHQAEFAGYPIIQATWKHDTFSQIHAWSRAREFGECLRALADQDGFTTKLSGDDKEHIEELLQDKYMYGGGEKYHVNKNAVEALIKAVRTFLAGMDVNEVTQPLKDAIDRLPPEVVVPVDQK